MKKKNLVMGYIRSIETSMIPDAVKLIILLFYYNTINSSILTDDESDTFLKLCEEKNKLKDLGNYSFKLIYKRSVDARGTNFQISML